MVVTMSSIAALAIFAVIGKSAVMFVSAVTIGAMVYVFRRARMRDRVIAIVAGALAGSIGAEIVHTFYHHLGAAGSGTGSDSGGFFISAMLVGLINTVAVILVIFFTEAWLKFAARKSR